MDPRAGAIKPTAIDANRGDGETWSWTWMDFYQVSPAQKLRKLNTKQEYIDICRKYYEGGRLHLAHRWL